MDQLSLNNIKTTLLLGSLTALLLFFGQKVGGQTGVVIALLVAGVINLTAYWFADKIVLMLYHAKPITPSEYPVLYSNMAYLSERANIPMPRLYLITDPSANAFATGRNPELAVIVVTTGLLELLNKDELAGVVAHELSHITRRDTLISTIAASVGGAVSVLAYFIQSLLIFGWGKKPQGERSNWISKWVMSFLAPMVAIFIRFAVSRSREYAADEAAAALCGNPLWLANALRKLENAREHRALAIADQHPATAHLFVINPLHHRQWSQLFSTHPPIGERIKRLEAMT